MGITFFNVLTVFCDIIFLQILMLNNAVPMTDGILMNKNFSVTYFVMSLVTLLFLYANHEAVSYMVLDYWGAFSLIYGLAIFLIGILGKGLDDALEASQRIWDTLSEFQQNYFDNNSMKLYEQRNNNTRNATIFFVVIGIEIIVMAIATFVLNGWKKKMVEGNIKWNPDKEMKSRAITVTNHQVCHFSYNKVGKAPEKHFSIQCGAERATKEDLD